MSRSIRIVGKTVKGVFRKRVNRFLALVEVENRIVQCYLPNSGRIYDLLNPGAKVVLR